MYQVMLYGHMIEVKIMEKLLVVMAKRRLRLLNRGLIPHSFPLLFWDFGYWLLNSWPLEGGLTVVLIFGSL